MSTHTPGRLTVTHNSWETSTIYCEGKEVARVHMDSEAHEDDEQHCENARRLTACWNYCEGLDTEGMQRAIEMKRPAKVFIDESIKKELELLAQRDALVEALREVAAWDKIGAFHRVHAAIAKAEGGA